MKIKIILEKKEMETMSMESLHRALAYFNTDRTEAYFKKRGKEYIEIVISKKEDSMKNICADSKINHFEDKEDYLNWLRRQNERRKKT